MKRLAVVGAALALFVLGVVAGGFWWRPAQAAQSVKAPEKAVSKPRIAEAGDEAALAALRHRIAELEAQLGEAQATQDEAVSNAVAAAKRERGPRWGASRLEEMKKTDPAQYQQITNRMAQFRRESRARAEAQLDFLSSVDTSRMSASARTTHARYQELIAQREELSERLHAEGLSDDERKALFEELHGTHQAMRMLGQSERTVLVEETARNLGFAGEDVKVISETMRDIVDATEPFNFHRHRGGRGGGGRGGRGGGPR